MSKAQTRTTERIESTVETVEIEELRCAVCEQWYADDDAVTAVAVGAQYDPDGELVTADHTTQVCTGCAESLFGVEAEPSRVDRVRAALQRPLVDVGAIPVSASTVRSLVSLGIGLAVAGIVASEVMSTMAAEVEAGAFEEAAPPAFSVVDVLPLLLLGLLIVLVIRVTAIMGPGEFRR